MDVLQRDVTLAALGAGLSALGKRQLALAQNIANVNTPGYKRRDIDFSAALAAALSAPAARDRRSTAADAQVAPRQERVQRILSTVAREVVEQDFFYRSDMGGVDIDREMAAQAETSLRYAALAQLAAKRIAAYRLVIRDGRM